jgi:Tol biopolymer transport system component
MATGTFLNEGMALVSPNKQYMAKMQYDGNFVVYNGNQETGTVMWQTSTSGNYLAFMSFQSDGNMCIYNSTGAFK